MLYEVITARQIRVNDAAESKGMLLGALDNVPGAARDIVVLNAGVALYTAKLRNNFV